MSSTIEPLILDSVEWVASEPRAYSDVMEAWRTSCPRLTVWEDAVDRGLVRREAREGSASWCWPRPKGTSCSSRTGAADEGHPAG